LVCRQANWPEENRNLSHNGMFNRIRDGIYVPKVRVKLGDLCDMCAMSEVFERVVGIMAKHSVYGAKCMFLAVSR